MPQFYYDEEYDTLEFWTIPLGLIVREVEIDRNIVLQYDKNGKAVGFIIERYKKDDKTLYDDDLIMLYNQYLKIKKRKNTYA